MLSQAQSSEAPGRVVSKMILSAEHIAAAGSPEQFPRTELPEIAFLGRSNVGKSSLLNTLVGTKAAARTSSRPGCTRLIHFYRVEGGICLVDLPGYGYARVDQATRLSWKTLIEEYLLNRPNLALSIVILDARRGWMEQDLELKRWLEFHGRRHLVVATKMDKLRSQSDQHHGMAAIHAQLGDSELVPFSAVTGRGAREIWQTISKIQNRV